jgi:hypothetical protein
VVSLVVGDNESRRSAWAKHCKGQKDVKKPEWFPCAANDFLFGGSPEKLLDAIPRRAHDLGSLWAVDEIVFKGLEPGSAPPRPLGASSFVAALHEILAKFAKAGKPEALDRMLVLQVAADGWYAEELAELNAAVFSESPAVLVDHFEVARPYRDRVDFGTTDVADRADSIRARYRAHCTSNELAEARCSEAASFLLQ